MAVYQIINMIAVGHCFVATVCPVGMGLLVGGTFVIGRTALGIVRVHGNCVVVYASAFCVVQVAIMKVINVTVVLYSRMAAVWPMLVRVRTCLSRIRL
jgi:hypothetical protein